MAMLGLEDYLCEACKHFDTDGSDGNHPNCAKQFFSGKKRHCAIRIGEECPYGFEFGIPAGYPVSMKRNRERAYEIAHKIGIKIDE